MDKDRAEFINWMKPKFHILPECYNVMPDGHFNSGFVQQYYELYLFALSHNKERIEALEKAITEASALLLESATPFDRACEIINNAQIKPTSLDDAREAMMTNDIRVDRGALRMAINVLTRAGKHEVVEALENACTEFVSQPQEAVAVVQTCTEVMQGHYDATITPLCKLNKGDKLYK